MNKEIEYMKEHPPRCLGTHRRPASSELRDFIQKELGRDSTVFTPLCACSNEYLGFRLPEHYGPTAIACPKCSETRVVFDFTKHGYDGELGHNDGLEADPVRTLACTECGHETFEMGFGFQYAGETDILEEDEDIQIKPEDLFGWLMIAAKCAECGHLQTVTNYECA
jgi:ribosomal protein S27E